jgi:PhnB protein
MPVHHVPKGYPTVCPYLVVPDPSQVIDFMQRVLDGQVIERMEGPDGRIQHAEVRLGDSVVMMGAASEEHPVQTAMLHIYVPDVDATYARALKAGATSMREPEDQFYGDRSGGVKDAVGNSWWFATHVEDVSPEELKRRAAKLADGG